MWSDNNLSGELLTQSLWFLVTKQLKSYIRSKLILLKQIILEMDLSTLSCKV